MTVVNLLDFSIWSLLMHLTRGFVVFNISNAILKDKYNKFITFTSIMVSTCIYAFFGLQFANPDNELIFMFFYFATMFAVIYIVTTGSLFAKIASVIFGHVAYLAATYIDTLLIKLIFKSHITNGIEYEMTLSELLTHVLFVVSSSFVFVASINFIKAKTNPFLHYRIKYSIYFIFPITHIFSTLLIYQSLKIITPTRFEEIAKNEPLLEPSIVFLIVLCLIIDIGIIFIVDRQSKTEEKNIQNEKELLKSELNYNQMQLLKREKSEFRKIKHDLVNLLTTAEGFIEIGKTEKALEILRKTNSDFAKISGVPFCSNETINTICYIKQQMADKSGVTLKIKIEETSFLNIDDYDICRLLHNIIDNSINAASTSDYDKSSEITIEIDPDFISITSRNHFSDTNKTLKQKSSEHGHGINIIKDIAKKYDGSYHPSKEGNIYSTVTQLKNISLKEADNNNIFK